MTGTQATYNSADVLSDGSSTDNDTLTISTTTDIDATPTVVGIENIVFNATGFASLGLGSTYPGLDGVVGNGDDVTADGTDFELNAEGIASGTITVNATQVATTIDSAIVFNVGDVAVVAGQNIASLTVLGVEGSAPTATAGVDTTVVNIDAAGTEAAATFNAVGDVALNATDVVALTINSSVASDISFAHAGVVALDTITGDANTTLVAATDISAFGGLTVTGVAGVQGAGNAGPVDLTGVAAPITITDSTTSNLTVADGVSVIAGAAGVDVTLTADNDADATTAIEQTATVTAATASTGAADLAITLADSATGDGITTLNLLVEADMLNAGGDVDITGGATLDETINISGAGDIGLALTAGAAGDMTVNASTLMGVLETTAGAGVVSITAGSGDDTITLAALAEADLTVDGGLGTDTLVAAVPATISEMTVSGFEILSGTFAGLASQFHNATYIIEAGSSLNIDSNFAEVDLSTINLSGLVFADDTDTVTVDASTIDTTLFLATQAFNITGSMAADTITGSANADTINGGAGADTIDGGDGDDTITGGEGSDDITGGAGDDTIILTETTAAADTVNLGTVATAGIDTIIGFDADNDVVDTGLTVAAIIDATAEDYDTGNATLAAAAGAVAAAEYVGVTVDAIVFNYGGDQYVLATADNAYTEVADVLFQLNGVDVDDLVATTNIV